MTHSQETLPNPPLSIVVLFSFSISPSFSTFIAHLIPWATTTLTTRSLTLSFPSLLSVGSSLTRFDEDGGGGGERVRKTKTLHRLRITGGRGGAERTRSTVDRISASYKCSLDTHGWYVGTTYRISAKASINSNDSASPFSAKLNVFLNDFPPFTFSLFHTFP